MCASRFYHLPYRLGHKQVAKRSTLAHPGMHMSRGEVSLSMFAQTAGRGGGGLTDRVVVVGEFSMSWQSPSPCHLASPKPPSKATHWTFQGEGIANMGP